MGRVNGYSTANKVVISVNRCLLNGQLKFNSSYKYGCVLVGKIEKYAELNCENGVYYVNDINLYETYQTSSNTEIQVKDSGVIGVTSQRLKGTNAISSVSKLGIETSAMSTSTWVALKEDFPTLRIFADANQIIKEEQDVVADTTWFDEVQNDVGLSSENPYIISDAGDLLGLAKLVNEGNTFENCYIQLKQDIFYNTDIESSEKNTFVPIGGTVAFKGHFDGNNCVINGIYISDTSASNVGLFGLIDGADIKNLTLKDSYIKGANNVGSIAGQGSGTIMNVSSNAEVVATNKAGGFVGQVNGTKLTVKDCTFSGEVKATVQCAAGIVGEILDVSEANKVVIENCIVSKDAKLTAEGADTSGGRVGGIVGNVGTSYLEVSNSKFLGTIEAQGATLGGIVARVNKNNSGGSNVRIIGCISNGSITCSGSGNIYVGGIIGGVWEDSVANIIRCSSTNVVSAGNGNRVSGAVGQLGKSTVNFNEVYVGGTVTAKEQCGGFVGRTEGNNATVNMTDCHFDGTLTVTTTGWGYAAGLVGYVPGVSGKQHVINATRCLLTGTLNFDTASNYKCILIGNINKYAQFTCKEGVYYITDSKITTTHKNQSGTGVTVTGVAGTDAVVKELSETALTGSGALDLATALKNVKNSEGNVIWGTTDKYPTLLNVPTE